MHEAENLELAVVENPLEEADQASSHFADWKIVLQTGDDDNNGDMEAFEQLFVKNWCVVNKYVRWRGFNYHEAEDLTQAFFVQVLQSKTFRRYDSTKGPFRAFLYGSLNNFLCNEWDKRQTLKRGGRFQMVSLDEPEVKDIYHRQLIEPPASDGLFDRQWACGLIKVVLSQLKEEYCAQAKGELFTHLEPALFSDLSTGLRRKAATVLGLSEISLRVALHRLRRRFSEILRRRVASGIQEPADLKDELRNLFAAVSVS